MMKDMSSLMGVGGGFLTPSLPLFVFALSLNWIHTQMGWEGRRDGGTEGRRYGTVLSHLMPICEEEYTTHRVCLNKI